MLFSRTMSMYDFQNHTIKMECDNPWAVFNYGISVFNSMKTHSFKGLSGEVHFDQHGNRENFQLEILKLHSDGIKSLGIWNSTTGLEMHVEAHVEPIHESNIFRGRNLKVLTVVEVNRLLKT